MERVDVMLSQGYGDHYRRINTVIDTEESFKGMELMCGKLVSGLPRGDKVLDIGCGTGVLLKWLSSKGNLHPVGIDMSPAQVAEAVINNKNVEVYCEDAFSYLSRHVNTFSGIFCVDVLEHMRSNEECLELLEAVRSSLKPNGFFFCRTPNAANLTGNYSRYMDLTHSRIFTASSLMQLFSAAGFADCRMMPVRSPRLTGEVRLKLEYTLHRAIFLVCGRGLERCFTSNINVVAYKL